MALDGPTLRLLIEANTQGAQASMGQLAGVTDREMKKAVNAIKPLADAIRAQERAAAQAATTMKKAANDEVEAAHRVTGAHAGVNRELLVLAHEMSQGNYSRFGGSMLVLAERTNALSFAMTGAGAATLGLGGAVLGTLAFMAKGAIDAAKFAKELQLTGNFAGTTADEIERMARMQRQQTGQTIGGARDSLTTVASSGLFGPDAMAAVARAAGDYEKLTGKTAEESFKVFEQMSEDAAKWAEATNRAFHFLTPVQYEAIRELVELGDKQGAAKLAAEAFAESIEGRAAPAMGYWARVVANAKNEMSGLAEMMEKIGRPRSTADDINDASNFRSLPGYMRGSVSDDSRMEDIRLMNRQQGEQAQAARDAAAKERANAEGIAANNFVRQWAEKGKAVSELYAKLKEYDAQAAKSSLSPDAIASGRSAIIKQFTPRGEVKADNEYGSLTAQINAYNIATGEEAAHYQKLSDAQKWSIQMHESLDKAAKNLGATRTKEIAGLIDNAAAEREAADIQIASRKRVIAAIVEQTSRDEEQAAKGSAFLSSGEEKVAAMIRQTAQIGLYGEALKEKQALDEIDLALMKANIGATAEQRAENERYAAQLRDHTVTALRDAKKAQDELNGSFKYGAEHAFKAYSEAAQNAAQQADEFITSTLHTTEDALTEFIAHGKWSWKSYVDSIITEWARTQIVRPLLGAASSGASDLINLFSADWGGGGTPHANGLSYVPYDGYLASLHEGEKVVSKQDVRHTSNGQHFDFSGASYSFGAGVNAQQMASYVESRNAALEGRIRRLSSTGAMG